MNRHARRAGRHEGCHAAYGADGSLPAHTPQECDGTCHEGEIRLFPLWRSDALERHMRHAFGPARPAGSSAARQALALLWALALYVRDSAEPPELWHRAIGRLQARARERAALVTQLLTYPRDRRGALKPAALAAAVTICPHTGPPAGLAASEAPVSSP